MVTQSTSDKRGKRKKFHRQFLSITKHYYTSFSMKLSQFVSSQFLVKSCQLCTFDIDSNVIPDEYSTLGLYYVRDYQLNGEIETR